MQGNKQIKYIFKWNQKEHPTYKNIIQDIFIRIFCVSFFSAETQKNETKIIKNCCRRIYFKGKKCRMNQYERKEQI